MAAGLESPARTLLLAHHCQEWRECRLCNHYLAFLTYHGSRQSLSVPWWATGRAATCKKYCCNNYQKVTYRNWSII